MMVPMIQDLPHRDFTTPDGHRVRVRLEPIDADVNAVIFEDLEGRLIGSARLIASYPLWSLTGEEVLLLWKRRR